MHPDISRLIKHTYPALQDHPSVAGHPPVLGLAPGRRVLFINHDVEEDGAARRGWSARQDLAQQSKSNGHEARLAVACVSYFVQQGYDASRIVILTPYLVGARPTHVHTGNTTKDLAVQAHQLAAAGTLDVPRARAPLVARTFHPGNSGCTRTRTSPSLLPLLLPAISPGGEN
jgi:hypothetical protein